MPLRLVAAVQDMAEAERFLWHLKLWKLPEDVVAIRGPLEQAAPIPEDKWTDGTAGADEWAA